MASNLTPQQIVQRWADRGSTSQDTVRAGVNAVTESPTEKAAARSDYWLRRLNEPGTRRKYEDNLRAVSLSMWKQAMIVKGIPNMQTGYANGREKFQRFMNAFLPFARQVGDEVRAMPRGNIQQSIDRARHVIMRFHEWGQTGGGQAPMPRQVG
jgi:hypothetical protein